MKRTGLVFSFLLLVSLFTNAQENFSITLNPVANLQQLPRVHSGAFAVRGNKWVFIGGRTNGLHGFYSPLAFPQNGANNALLVYEPTTDLLWSYSLFNLPDTLREILSCSNMQFHQIDSVLYLVGGYGWKDQVQDFVTFPNLTRISLDALITAVTNGNNPSSAIRTLHHTNLAVCGGEMDFIDNRFSLVFGHRFDGVYVNQIHVSPVVQQYTCAVRSFEVADSLPGQLDVINYSSNIDSVQFHRRDYNLVPQVFPDGEIGATAFSGVFLPGINQPYHNTINIKPSGIQVNNNFNQYLSAYTCATIPVWDQADTVMHTLFFGGMAKFLPDTLTGGLLTDTLVPFVTTISKVSRFANGSMSENWLPISMPFYLGTNARFVPHSNIPSVNGKIVSLNDLNGVTPVGYILGGIISPDANISQTDPSVSEASGVVLEVFIDKTITGLQKTILEPVSVSAGPNPANDFVQVEITLVKELKGIKVALLSLDGKEVLDSQAIASTPGKQRISIPVKDFAPGLYYLKIGNQEFFRTEPLIIQR